VAINEDLLDEEPEPKGRKIAGSPEEIEPSSPEVTPPRSEGRTHTPTRAAFTDAEVVPPAPGDDVTVAAEAIRHELEADELTVRALKVEILQLIANVARYSESPRDLLTRREILLRLKSRGVPAPEAEVERAFHELVVEGRVDTVRWRGQPRYRLVHGTPRQKA
jgi:hypothetical protein